MKKQTSIVLAAAVLLAGVSAASAAPSLNANMSRQPTDTLKLTIRQRNVAWNDLRGRTEQKATPKQHWTLARTEVCTLKPDQRVDQFMRLREVIEEQASRKFFDEQIKVDRPVVLRSNDFSIVASLRRPRRS